MSGVKPGFVSSETGYVRSGTGSVRNETGYVRRRTGCVRDETGFRFECNRFGPQGNCFGAQRNPVRVGGSGLRARGSRLRCGGSGREGDGSRGWPGSTRVRSMPARYGRRASRLRMSRAGLRQRRWPVERSGSGARVRGRRDRTQEIRPGCRRSGCPRPAAAGLISGTGSAPPLQAAICPSSMRTSAARASASASGFWMRSLS